MFWPSERADIVRVERKKVRHATRQPAPKVEAVKDTTKPVGPPIISISIEKQQLRLIDNNGVFAESPVSTGMPGHSTPMGVFSVIGKEVFHRSNIYSGAPMPHMQRITWSGVAMHEGVLPGRPASHGCIRLPGAFATRLFGWTKMGARVIITPGEMNPSDFSHRLLVTQKPENADPNMPVAAKPEMTTTPKADKADAASELRLTTTGTGEGPKKSDEIKTADASGTIVAKPDAGTDAKPEIRTEPKSDEQNANKDQARPQDKPAAATLPAPRPTPGMADFVGPIKPNTGQVAGYVSRKEGKFFVRQAFKPVFTAPVTIAPGDKPLGTHVFTVKSEDDGKLAWTVVSLPAPSRAARQANAEYTRKKKVVAPDPGPPPQPSTATEALDRITIPDEAMKRFAAVLGPGGSLVVSDEGLGGETGEGTDFIVPLR